MPVVKGGSMAEQIAPAWPPGHFYSPIVNTVELDRWRVQVFDRTRAPSDVNLCEGAQLAFLRKMKPHYDRLPFPNAKLPILRYFYDNPMFGYGDAITFACLLMEVRPHRILEIGSGY